MVSLAFTEPRSARATLSDRANLLPPALGLAAAFLAVASFSSSGPDSWPYASELVVRFATLAFPLAIAVGPAGRLMLGGNDWRVGRWSRMSLLGFAAIYAVFLLCVALPYFMTDSRMPLSTTGFCFFNTFILCALAVTATEHFSSVVGNRTVDTIHRVAVTYFWLVFAFADVAHLYGPHRPDGFYGLSLCLLVGAVLVRFADAFAMRLRAHLAEHSAWQEKRDDWHFRQSAPAVKSSHVRSHQVPFGRDARVQGCADPGRRRAVADFGGRE